MPVVALGNDVVVIDGDCAAAATVMLRFALAVAAGELESVTRTVNAVVPVCVGVPEITPELEMTNPAGKLPFVTAQLYGPVPPVAAKFVE